MSRARRAEATNEHTAAQTLVAVGALWTAVTTVLLRNSSDWTGQRSAKLKQEVDWPSHIDDGQERESLRTRCLTFFANGATFLGALDPNDPGLRPYFFAERP